ncbi:MAG: DUF4249 domain-containing protein [Bacteroidota bacterium]
MKRLQSLILTLSCVLGTGCTFEPVTFEELGVPMEPLPYAVIVDGFISTLRAPVQVRLTQPIAAPDSIRIIPVTTATVRLFENGNLLGTLAQDVEPGLYLSPDSLQGQVGGVYTLEINLDGETITATDTLPPTIPDFDFPATLDRISSDGFLEFGVTEQNFGYDAPSIWTWWEEPTIAFDLYRNERIRNIINHRGNIPAGVFPTATRGTGFSGFNEDRLDVYKLNISESYYQYLLGRLFETDWQAGIFSTIPGNVPSNVNGGGGYFWATSVSQWTVSLSELAE